MESKKNIENDKYIRLQEKAKEILAKMNADFEKEVQEKGIKPQKFDPSQMLIPTKKLRIKTRIPVSFSPEVKKRLRQDKTLEKSKRPSLIVNLKDPISTHAKISIQKEIKEEKKEEKKRLMIVDAPRSHVSSISQSMKVENPLNRDVLLEKVKRRKTIKSRRRSRKK